MSNEISEVTRRAIVDLFSVSGIRWSGRLDDHEFLARLYDLATLPSTDYRYRNAAQDIYQHRIRNAGRRLDILRSAFQSFARFRRSLPALFMRNRTSCCRDFLGRRKEVGARLQQGTCRRWLAARRDKADFRKTCIWCPKDRQPCRGLRGANRLAESRSPTSGSAVAARYSRL